MVSPRTTLVQPSDVTALDPDGCGRWTCDPKLEMSAFSKFELSSPAVQWRGEEVVMREEREVGKKRQFRRLLGGSAVDLN